MTAPKLENYLMETGYYNVGKIMVDSNEYDERQARFADIFGDAPSPTGDADETVKPKMSPEWQALYDEAKRLNDEKHEADSASAATEARAEAAAIMQQPGWQKELNAWHCLRKLGFAEQAGLDVSPLGDDMPVSELNDAGKALLAEIENQASARTTTLPAPVAVETITAKEAAARLGVSLSTIYRRIRAGKLQATKDQRGRWQITWK